MTAAQMRAREIAIAHLGELFARKRTGFAGSTAPGKDSHELAKFVVNDRLLAALTLHHGIENITVDRRSVALQEYGGWEPSAEHQETWRRICSTHNVNPELIRAKSIRIERVLKARVDLVRSLRTEYQMTGKEISEHTKISAGAVSKHLRALRRREKRKKDRAILVKKLLLKKGKAEAAARASRNDTSTGPQILEAVE